MAHGDKELAQLHDLLTWNEPGYHTRVDTCNEAIKEIYRLRKKIEDDDRIATEASKNWISDRGRVEETEEAMESVRPFVRREQNHGKHEQDRADATEWLEKHGEGG